jgi:transposase
MDEQVEPFRWFVGLDWASAVHRICVVDDAGKRIAERDVRHEGAALGEMCGWLCEVTGARPAAIAVAIETPRGPVVEALLEHGFAVFAINPKQLDRFRDRFSPAGAKDDSRDALVLGHSLRTDRQAFRRVVLDDPLVIELREFSRMHDELKQEQTRLTNRMRDQLWRYYPQMGAFGEDFTHDWFLDLWEVVPTPAKAARVREHVIARVLKNNRIRRFDAAGVLAILRQPPIMVAAGTIEAATAHIRALAARLRLVNTQIKETERRLDELCTAIEAAAQGAGDGTVPGQICEQRDVAILRSCPGLGRINVAALLAEAGEPLRRRDYHALRVLSGVAPVTRRSGRSCVVVQRHACNTRLQSAAYHWARVAIQRDPTSRARYAALRARGHNHARASRSVADRLIYVLCTLLQRQVLFDPSHAAPPASAAA